MNKKILKYRVVCLVSRYLFSSDPGDADAGGQLKKNKMLHTPVGSWN